MAFALWPPCRGVSGRRSYDKLFARFPELLQLVDDHELRVCLAGVKITIHEFGHGLQTAAKHFGGEVHEMGILLLVLTPALYCGCSPGDEGLCPTSWKTNLDLGCGHLLPECLLAGIATFVWWYSTPGLLNSLAYGDDVHLLGEHHPRVQRESPAPVRRLLRDG